MNSQIFKNNLLKSFFLTGTTFVISFLFFSVFAGKVQAYITERNYDRVYTVGDDYLQVSEKKTLRVTQSSWYIPAGSEESFIIFNPIEGDPNLVSKKQATLDSIIATDSLGNNLSYRLENSEKGNTLILVKTARLVRYNETYTISLSYKSFGLLLKSGAVRDAYIPAFSESYIFESDSTKETVTTKLISPKSFGEINFSVPSTSVAEDSDNYTLNYSQQILIGDTGWVQIGKKQFYTFKIEQPYTSSTSIPFSFNTYKIIIPRDIQSGFVNQKIFFTSISPEPEKIVKDSDGNLLAYFRVPAVDNGKIEINGYAVLEENNEFNLEDSGNLNDIPKEIANANTKDAKYWEVDTVDIQNLALELKGSETDVYKLIEKTYKYVVDKIDYSDIKRFGINNRQGALKTLQGGAAVCMEYSDLFITLLRAMGIPARGAFGYGYSSLDYESITDGSINHQWAEVYLPKQNIWVPADTTWGESGNLLIGGDLSHFYSHVASVNPETPATTEVAFYGSSPDLADRIMNVEVVEEKDIVDLNGKTQAEVLAAYKEDVSFTKALTSFTDSVKLFWDRSENQTKNTILIASGTVIIIVFSFITLKVVRNKKLSHKTEVN